MTEAAKEHQKAFKEATKQRETLRKPAKHGLTPGHRPLRGLPAPSDAAAAADALRLEDASRAPGADEAPFEAAW